MRVREPGERIAEPAHTPDPPRSAEAEAEQALLVLQMKGQEDGEEKGKQLVVQAPEGAEADQEFGDSSVQMARKRTSCSYTDIYECV